MITPDGAKAMVQLALTDDAYGENWNIPGYSVITGEEIVSTLRGYNRLSEKGFNRLKEYDYISWTL